MPILSSLLDRMGYSYLVCREQPRGHPSVDPSTLGGISPYVTRLPQVLLHCVYTDGIIIFPNICTSAALSRCY